MTNPKIGIASYEEMKARTLAIARGELKPAAGDPKVWFTPTEIRTSREGYRVARKVEDLSEAEIEAIANSRMDPRHDHLNDLLDE
jgi:hypothetical protein